MNRSYGQIRPPKYLAVKIARTDYIVEGEGPEKINRDNPDIWNRNKLLSDLDENEETKTEELDELLDNSSSSFFPLMDLSPNHSNDPDLFVLKIKYDLPNLPDTFVLETPRNCIQELGTIVESFEFNSPLSISRQMEYNEEPSERASCCLRYRDGYSGGRGMPYDIQTSLFIQREGRDVLNHCYAKFGGSENLYNKIDKNCQNEYDFELHLNYNERNGQYNIVRGTIFLEDIQNLRSGRNFAVFYWYCGSNLELIWNHHINSYVHKMEVSPIFSLLK